MPTWRCPHCRTPQAEGARCWVCRRSSVECSSCTHFRNAIALGRGFCALERRRRPLSGEEVRPCWVARTAVVARAVPFDRGPGPDRARVEPMFASVPAADPIQAELPTRFWVDADP